MTNEEKAIKVAELLKPEVVETASVLPFVELAGAVILNRLHPFGELGDETVPPRYDHIQCMIAVDLWNKRGAEGQTSHSENGITRTWASSHVSPNLLRLIVPSVGSVV
jgi:hypothetical protein